MPLADPRRYGAGEAAHPLLELASRDEARDALVLALRELAAARRDEDIDALLAAAPSAEGYARVWHALTVALEQPPDDAGVATRVFAIPWVIVCGASAPATVACVLSDVAGLAAVLEANGAFGASRNLGFSNALASIDALERLRAHEVLEATTSPALREVAPAPFDLLRGAEEIHVRFLVGAAIAPAQAPGIIETGSNIGAWGARALKAMAAQLATPGVQLLPMPRPPAGLYTAAWAGRRAGIEAAFNLFMSNAVRRFRSTVGDPDVTLSAHAGGELRVTLSSALDDTLVERFRWPLHPADDLGEIERTIASLVLECRLSEPRCLSGVLPDTARIRP